jgi:hypothetical protein
VTRRQPITTFTTNHCSTSSETLPVARNIRSCTLKRMKSGFSYGIDLFRRVRVSLFFFQTVSLIQCLNLVFDIEGGCNTLSSFPDSFLGFLVVVPCSIELSWAITHSRAHLTPASTAWWAPLAIAHEEEDPIWWIFRDAHDSVRAVLNIFKNMYLKLIYRLHPSFSVLLVSLQACV